MKHRTKRGVALALALVMAVSPVASASDALGHDLHTANDTISLDTTVTEQIFWSDTYSDLRTEHYISYTASDAVTPVIVYGDTVLSRDTLTAAAQSLEAQGQRVVGGINGDFYVMATGNPLGLVMTDGVVHSTPTYYNSYALGFYEDGTAIIGQPEMRVTATIAGNALSVNGGINKIRSSTGGYTLLTDEFGSTTQNTSPGIDVILVPVTTNIGTTVYDEREVIDIDVEDTDTDTDTDTDDSAYEVGEGMLPEGVSDSSDLTADMFDDLFEDVDEPDVGEESVSLVQSTELVVGGRVTYTVEQVLQSTGSIEIPEGKVVLTIHEDGDEWLKSQLTNLQVGDTIDVDITVADDAWVDVDQALGALYKIVTNGVAETMPDGASSVWNGATARTAVGIKADGTTIFYTIDGLQAGYSVGATMTQVAKRLIELGCVEAVCMDGGGSTTLGASYTDSSSMELVSSPSGGTQRANSTAIFLTTSMSATGVLGSYRLEPSDAMVLGGSQISFAPVAVDTGYYDMSYYDTSDLSYVATGVGTIDSTGTFTASTTSGTAQVWVSGSGATGYADVTVVAQPDSFTVSREGSAYGLTALTVDIGEQVDLTATATYKTLDLVSTDNAYTWYVDPLVGYVDENGLFTAGQSAISGDLTVTVGTTTVTIPVRVAGSGVALETFEGSFSSITSSLSATATPETAFDYVRYGNQSMAVTYDTSENGTAGLVTNLSIPDEGSYMGMWVYGDQSGNLLTATTADLTGVATDVLITALDFSGWQHVSVALPEGTTTVRAIEIVYGGVEGMTASKIWIDHITSSNEDICDTTPPEIAVTMGTGQVTATITDNFDRYIPKESVVVTWDGGALDFTWNEDTGALSATLPASDTSTHRITVTAVDISGNMARSSVDQVAVGESVSAFSDTEGHWAAQYADYLYATGVTNGVSVGDTLEFQPNKEITRGEFFTMVARWLNLDLTAYDYVELPFADADQIPTWFLSEIKAMYATGILSGSYENGVLMCNANATITRSDAMTILGRTQSRGYVEADLTTFTDADQIPFWSTSYVAALVGQGVVNGYNNEILPLNPVTRGEVAKMLYSML